MENKSDTPFQSNREDKPVIKTGHHQDDGVSEKYTRYARPPIGLAGGNSVTMDIFLRAKYLHEIGAYQEAADLYVAVLHRAPEHVYALNNLGILRMRDGKFQEAEEHFRRAISRCFEYPEAHYNVGKSSIESGRHQVVEDHLKRAIEFAPERWEYMLDLGVWLLSSTRTQEAIPLIKSALQLYFDEAIKQFDQSQRSGLKTLQQSSADSKLSLEIGSFITTAELSLNGHHHDQVIVLDKADSTTWNQLIAHANRHIGTVGLLASRVDMALAISPTPNDINLPISVKRSPFAVIEESRLAHLTQSSTFVIVINSITIFFSQIGPMKRPVIFLVYANAPGSFSSLEETVQTEGDQESSLFPSPKPYPSRNFSVVSGKRNIR